MRHGAETVGVVVAPVGDCWRARIITYPSEFWTVSRGAAVMKFYADSPEVAEQDAVDYVEAFMQNVDWEVVSRRYETAVRLDALVRA